MKLDFTYAGLELTLVWVAEARHDRSRLVIVDDRHARAVLGALVLDDLYRLRALLRRSQHHDADRLTDRQVIDALADALTARRLIVQDLEDRFPGSAGASGPSQPPPKKPSKPPRKELTFFDLRVVDDVGDPIDGIDVVLAAAGTDHQLTTDADGRVHLGDVDAGVAVATVPSTDQLRKKLRPRWQKPRDPKHPTGPQVVVQQLDEKIEPVSLDNEVLTTLVILPRFECRELGGTVFRYGRSFVSKSGLEVLRGVAAVLSDAEDGRNGALFGHTDEGGATQRDKELSERRAEAVYAMLLHDHARWERLWSGTSDAAWREKWGPREAQHMLNALEVQARGGALAEDGVLGPITEDAIRRFQSGEYPKRPPDQAPLEKNGKLDEATRKEMFLAYTKLAIATPVEAARIAQVGDGAFMGCAGFNPLKPSGLDAESRRVVALLFDPAAQPVGLPCSLRQLGPCNANTSNANTKVPPKPGKPPYRCSVYRDVASRCPCSPGPDLTHDLIVVLPFTTDFLKNRPEVLVLESEDHTLRFDKALATEAVPEGPGRSSVRFKHLPDVHSYHLRCEHGSLPHEVFTYTPYEELSNLSPSTEPDPKKPTAGQI